MIIWLGGFGAFRLDWRRPSNVLVQDVWNGGQFSRWGLAQGRVAHLQQEATIVYDTGACMYVRVCVWSGRRERESKVYRHVRLPITHIVNLYSQHRIPLSSTSTEYRIPFNITYPLISESSSSPHDYLMQGLLLQARIQAQIRLLHYQPEWGALIRTSRLSHLLGWWRTWSLQAWSNNWWATRWRLWPPRGAPGSSSSRSSVVLE